ncbi:MAG: hypothetical protein HGA87_00420 [Desulfobulbaceae bacterium]|nr:hypothetical protein [Desulfobulbaceae bacterium]
MGSDFKVCDGCDTAADYIVTYTDVTGKLQAASIRVESIAEVLEYFSELVKIHSIVRAR